MPRTTTAKATKNALPQDQQFPEANEIQEESLSEGVSLNGATLFPDASPMDLPPEGFLLLLMARRVTDQISEEDFHAQIHTYITLLGDTRKGVAAASAMSQFLGRMVSVAQAAAPYCQV